MTVYESRGGVQVSAIQFDGENHEEVTTFLAEANIPNQIQSSGGIIASVDIYQDNVDGIVRGFPGYYFVVLDANRCVVLPAMVFALLFQAQSVT